MAESTIEPKTIEIDTIKNGIVNILAHWDIVETERIDEMSGKTQTMYVYNECRMSWVLPYAMSSIEDIEEYFVTIEDELLNWAKGSKVTL